MAEPPSSSYSWWRLLGVAGLAGGGAALILWQSRQIQLIRGEGERLRAEVCALHEALLERVERRLAALPSGDQLERLARLSGGFLGSAPQSVCSDDYYTDANEEWLGQSSTSSASALATAPPPPPSSSSSSSSSQDLPPLSQVAMEAIDKLIEEAPEKAYAELKKMYSEGRQKDVEVLWRLGRACKNVANDYDRKNPKKKEMILEGRGYAQAAAALDDKKFIVLKWAAILTGTATDYVGTKEKIEQGNVFKSYLDKALVMDPKEYSLLHMRGRYAYSVANLSWLERKAAAAFFAAPPEATIDEALRDFLAANEVRPKWIENLMYIARCYVAKKDSKNAAVFLKETLAVAPVDDNEKELLEEAKTLLKKHGG